MQNHAWNVFLQKSGVKFSSEEERTVIDLQAQFGNKWAKIATFLPGRTDNDVKNFWSSRQKRLARILHNASSSSSTSSSSNNNNKSRKSTKHHHVLAINDVPYVEDVSKILCLFWLCDRWTFSFGLLDWYLTCILL